MDRVQKEGVDLGEGGVEVGVGSGDDPPPRVPEKRTRRCWQRCLPLSRRCRGKYAGCGKNKRCMVNRCRRFWVC